jgi:hypothetical protein
MASNAAHRSARYRCALASPGFPVLLALEEPQTRPAGDHPEAIQLIRRMCRANPLWGAPRIHGELLKLGIEVCETTVAKYMIKRRSPPSQAWKTFIENHLKDTIALDFFTVPTATFRVLFVLVILSHDRRRACWRIAPRVCPDGCVIDDG